MGLCILCRTFTISCLNSYYLLSISSWFASLELLLCVSLQIDTVFQQQNISSIELLNWSCLCSLSVYSDSAKQLKPAMNLSVFGRDTETSDHKRKQTRDFLFKCEGWRACKRENVAFRHNNIIFVLSKNNKDLAQQRSNTGNIASIGNGLCGESRSDNWISICVHLVQWILG